MPAGRARQENVWETFVCANVCANRLQSVAFALCVLYNKSDTGHAPEPLPVRGGDDRGQGVRALAKKDSGGRMRLDRLLAMMGEGTRTQVREVIRAGRVTVDGTVVRDAAAQVDAEASCVAVGGRTLCYRSVRHVMMNKPQGTLTAARDKKQKTVMDLLPPMYAAMDCMPAGRLDKDTEGLLVITSDGQLAHRIISPKHDVGKVYFARVDGPLDEKDTQAFAQGLHISDSDGEFDARPARLEILSVSDKESETRVRVTEGKYHQVKRMFASRGVQVTYLKRLQIGALKLDPALAPGEWREMTEEEVALLEQEAED